MRRGSVPSRLQAALLWLALVILCIGALAVYQRAALLSELTQASTTLHAEASQRADQHDAHLTALSTVAQAEVGRRSDLFLEVAATILRFYPRISEVQLVPLDPAGTTIGTRELEADLASAIREAARASTGEPKLLTHPTRPGHYLIVKRSPNTAAARHGLALAIDAGRLLASEASFWRTHAVAMRLGMPGGETVFGPARLPVQAQFSKPLGSATQPLLLEAAAVIDWARLVPLREAAVATLAASLLFFAGFAMLRQRARTREAERRAELSGMEARLTHASRVNAMGEMASGMAHELTQPLTAILAQAQAGRRLLARGDGKALATALDDMVAQARRASNILDRLRNWSRPQRRPEALVDLRVPLRNVEALLASEARRNGVRIELHMPDQPLLAAADPVEIEQVMFNLLRNAIEAVSGMDGDRRAAALLKIDGRHAVIEVADSGPGVSPDLVPRLFTPFTTTKAEGTGLGLTLSQRLVERSGGDITYVASARGAQFRVTLPLVDASAEAAE